MAATSSLCALCSLCEVFSTKANLNKHEKKHQKDSLAINKNPIGVNFEEALFKCFEGRALSSKTNSNDVVELDSDDEVTRPFLKRTAKKSTTVGAANNAAANTSAAAETTKQTPAVTTRRQIALAIAATNKKNQAGDKFLENFDPDSSARERRKLSRKFNSMCLTRKVAGAVYDENGVHIASGVDLCDCFNKSCTGCHFPCPKCKSLKCGPECRCNRKYIYEQIEYHECDYIIKNPFLK